MDVPQTRSSLGWADYPTRLPSTRRRSASGPISWKHANSLGSALSQMPGRLPEAIAGYESALRINPNYADAHFNFGNAFSQMRSQLGKAITDYEAALRIGRT